MSGFLSLFTPLAGLPWPRSSKPRRGSARQWTNAVIERQISADGSPCGADAVIGFETNLFIFDGPLLSFDENIVAPCTFAIDADPNGGLLHDIGKGVDVNWLPWTPSSVSCGSCLGFKGHSIACAAGRFADREQGINPDSAGKPVFRAFQRCLTACSSNVHGMPTY